MTHPTTPLPRPLHRRLEMLTLGLGAAAAGAALSPKADAGISMVSGFQVNDTTLYLGADGNIALDPTNSANPIMVQPGSAYGWNMNLFAYYTGTISGSPLVGSLYAIGNGFSFSLYTSGGFYSGTLYISTFASEIVSLGYQFLSSPFLATATFNLATLGTSDWSNYLATSALTAGDYYLGLRRTFTSTDPANPSDGTAIYGWAQIRTDFGLTHLQSAFNFDSNGPITLGQVPEPSRAVLLAAGLASVALARRRRQQEEAA